MTVLQGIVFYHFLIWIIGYPYLSTYTKCYNYFYFIYNLPNVQYTKFYVQHRITAVILFLNNITASAFCCLYYFSPGQEHSIHTQITSPSHNQNGLLYVRYIYGERGSENEHKNTSKRERENNWKWGSLERRFQSVSKYFYHLSRHTDAELQ